MQIMNISLRTICYNARMNIHPLVVHFPIALLTLYSVLEVTRRWTKQNYWKPMRAVLVCVGTFGAFMSLQTGEIAEHAYGSGMNNVLETHSTMANVTTYVYAFMAAMYVLDVLEARGYLKSVAWLTSIKNTVLRSPLADVFAIIGFVALGLVGALGGILVYGPEADFVTSLVYKAFF